MDYKSIQELIQTMSESNLSLLEVESDGIKIKMEKKKEEVVVERVTHSLQSLPVHQSPMPVKEMVQLEQAIVKQEAAPAVEESESFHVVTSPIVGTFYCKPGPDAEEFVQVGSSVRKGDVLCIIEAMKLMNEIEAEVDGEVVEILVKNESMVEYGQPLFKIKA